MNALTPTPMLARPAAGGAWRRSLVLLILLQLGLLLAYHDTVAGMLAIWSRSETFTHGFLVPPLSLWLIWRQRAQLRGLPPRPSWAALPLLALAGFAWLLGALTSTNVLAQFALVFSLILTVPAVLGWPIARQLAFPLGFLLFAVPFGEFVIPTLMAWTADFTVLGLRFSGVPVYREGLEFVIPSGKWSVVEACSGVRYLIASLMVGTLFAYLNYVSLKRRLVFVLVAALVPILANWVRAYLIVMLGHWSGNTLAVGVDHLIYGWLFFGIVILTMFWIGARWQENPSEPVTQAAPVLNDAAPLRLWPMAGALALLLALWPVWRMQIAQPAVAMAPLTEALAVPGWTAGNAAFTAWQAQGDTPALRARWQYQADAQQVGLELAYFRAQGEYRKAISSRNVLVHQDDKQWKLLSQAGRAVPLMGVELKVQEAQLQAASGQQLQVWRWYWVAGRWTDIPRLARAYTAWSQLSGQGDDTAVLTLFAERAQAEAAMPAFVQAALPALTAQLNTLKEAR